MITTRWARVNFRTRRRHTNLLVPAYFSALTKGKSSTANKCVYKAARTTPAHPPNCPLNYRAKENTLYLIAFSSPRTQSVCFLLFKCSDDGRAPAAKVVWEKLNMCSYYWWWWASKDMGSFCEEERGAGSRLIDSSRRPVAVHS